MEFFKYHGLGNDYIVLDPKKGWKKLTDEAIKLICHRNYGVGSDGILFGPLKAGKNEFSLKIYNPDGSEAEKSGNGLRIFSRYLWDNKLVGSSPFTIVTPGGKVISKVLDNGNNVLVEMGKVSFDSYVIPVKGITGEVINKKINVKGRELTFCAATVGNPHCVIIMEEISPDIAKNLGPVIETNPLFPNRTNVQFLKVLDNNSIAIEIWERGAGYTLASGSSSIAAAAVAKKLNHCKSPIKVVMPGGTLDIELSIGYEAKMLGPVVAISQGKIDKGIFK